MDSLNSIATSSLITGGYRKFGAEAKVPWRIEKVQRLDVVEFYAVQWEYPSGKVTRKVGPFATEAEAERECRS